MTNKLKLLGSVLIFAVAALALPPLAAGSPPNGSKFYTLAMSASGNIVTATLMNTSPPNTSGATTSSINSVDLFVDLGWLFDPDSITVQGKPYKTKSSQQPAGHVKVVTPSPIKPGTNLVITFTVTNSSGDGTFGALVYTGANFNGNQFAPDPTVPQQPIASVATASLSCGGQKNFTVVAGTIKAERGAFNKDGTTTGDAGDPCLAIPYFASNTFANNVGLPPNIDHFRWDQSETGSPAAAFDYTVYYSAPPTTPHLGWLYQDGTPATNAGANPNANANGSNPVVFIVAPMCLADQLPLPYGTGTLADSSTTTLSFSSTDSQPQLSPPPVGPTNFPIYVDLERMQVTSINDDGTWTVARGQLGTTPAPHSGALVMSTPLPPIDTTPAAFLLLPNGTFTPAPTNPYQANTVDVPHSIQAQVCIATTGVDGGSGLPFIKFIDIGDSWGVPR